MREDRIVASLIDVKKIYHTGDTSIVALDSTSLDIRNQQLTLIMGPSGSGKTTLLSLIGCIIYPTEGKVIIQGDDISNYSEKKMANIRLNNISFIFQHFNLINPLNALENVMQPLLLRGEDAASAKLKAISALEKVNMGDRQKNLPKKLSGGQKQRVAIARALVANTEIILCDEPTASLDAKSAAVVMKELKSLAQQGKAIVVVTHDLRLRPFADRIVYVEEGMVSDHLKNEDDYK
ncbi:ABC transporter ATP-binding protein [Pedobacter gandavensis]|uniref:ABC transporter ATP-binding protein n=1 Tax=Pedobacter TaxID=84567 RepID=UPI001C991DD4|nr:MULTISPECIES: ABC transporter ATP-binding protein [Pedobacter]WGQ09768.1 ABC transporter ATP-binding protein [Pedobacter gandavensis]